MRCRTTILLLVLVAAGCAGRVQTLHEGEGYSRAALRAGRIAVGGVVMAARLQDDPDFVMPDGVPRGDVLAQGDAWSSALYGGLLAASPQTVVWPFPVVSSALEDSSLVDALQAVARGAVLHASQLQRLAAPLESLDYLAVARIDGDEQSLHEGTAGAVDNQRARDGRDLHGSPRDSALKTRRAVTVTLDVYDLAAGRSVWTATVTRHRDELYNFADEAGSGRPPVVPAGQPVITADGRPLPTADFTPVLQDACNALARSLLEEPESR